MLTSINKIVLLHNKLRDSDCQTFIADMKVRIATQANYNHALQASAINHFLNGAI